VKEGSSTPIYDFRCEKCGSDHLDKYVPSGEVNDVLICGRREGVDGKVLKKTYGTKNGKKYVKTETIVDGKECGGKLVKVMSVPAPPVMRVGRWGGPQAKREQSVAKKKKLLRRSYEHEFKRGGKGVDERRERIRDLRKKGVPLPNVPGWG
jgi:hypothetical protein